MIPYSNLTLLWNYTNKTGCPKCKHMHCRKICEIQRYIALPNIIIHPCNSLYFYVSNLVWTLFPNQFRYEEIQSVTLKFYRVRQCSISVFYINTNKKIRLLETGKTIYLLKCGQLITISVLFIFLLLYKNLMSYVILLTS